MVNLLRFYQTDSAIYLLLQHASGGKLWNYVCGYLQQHNDTQLEDVYGDVHERKLRSHSKTSTSETAVANAKTQLPVINNGALQKKNLNESKGHNHDSKNHSEKTHSSQFNNNGSNHANRAVSQESESDVGTHRKLQQDDSLSLDDTTGADQTSQSHKWKHYSISSEDNLDEPEGGDRVSLGNQSDDFSRVLKGTDTSMTAFTINSQVNSFESEGDTTGSRFNSTTSEHGIESIPEAQCENSPVHAPDGGGLNSAMHRPSQGDVFESKMDSNKNGATNTQTGVLNADNSDTNNLHTEINDDNLDAMLPSVPSNFDNVSLEGPSIYDIHRPTETDESESDSIGRPNYLNLNKSVDSRKSDDKTPNTGSTVSTPMDPERKPEIFRLPSQERSLESDVRPRKRNLSSVFRDLDLADSEIKSKAHLPESCVRQWAAELVVAIGTLHSMGIICRYSYILCLIQTAPILLLLPIFPMF